MICPKCGKDNPYTNRYCDGCRSSLANQRRIISISNRYYNSGLEKAKLRDLTGAIMALKCSLQVNKMNTDARNLLGLVYYEMGETVLALGEWVLSKNYQEENNLADHYMDQVQNNPSKLHNTNAVIKKYNYALSQAQGGNYDVAILQLKKVVAAQPKYVAAQQLLALMYMQKGDNDKAAKILRKVQQIDINNTITLRYLAELGLNPSAVKVDREIAKRNQTKGKELEKAEDPQFYAPGPELRDGKINKWSLLHILIGVVIGLFTVVFLVLPTRESAIAGKYNQEAVKMAEEQSDLASQIQTLENDKSGLQDKINELEHELQKVKDEAVDEKAYNDFHKAIMMYVNGENEEAAKKLIKVEIDKFDSSVAKKLYNVVGEQVFPDMSKKVYKEGYSYFYRRDYENAINYLGEALKYDPNNVEAMYYMARSYESVDNTDKAKKYYKKIIKNYAGHRLVSDATRRLDSISE